MFNRIIEICMRNRMLVIVVFIMIALAGLWALKNTPVDAIPDIGENQVIVFADWPGRSPQDIQDQVIYPLSITMQGIPHVKYVRATAMFSFGYINIIFKENVDFYWARTRVLEKINTALKDMPEGVVPALGPDGTGIGQIFWYTVENGYYCPDHPAERYADPGKCPEDGKELIPSRLDLHELRSWQDWTIRYYLAAADGVAEVATVGGYVKQYQVDIDPNLLIAYGVKPAAVFGAIRSSNVDVGAKVVEEGGMEFLIRGVGFIKSIEDIENIVVAESEGVPIYVKNLGVVSIGPDFRRGALDKGGIPAVGGVVLMRYGDNPLRVIQNVKQKIIEIEPGLPAGVRIVPFYDRTALINRATDTLKSTLTTQIVVASLVILLFLGQLSSSIIISMVLPLGILFSFLGMKIIGLPSNIMSMAGIAIAIGVMVDAGIVMTENITRLLREPHPGESRVEVSIRAAKEVGNPIMFAMLIIIVAFVPVFSLTGQAGKLFKPLAFTKTFAMGGAAFVALCLIPVLSSLFLPDPTRRQRWWNRIFATPFFPLRKLAQGTTWLLHTIYRPIISLAVMNIWTKLSVIAIAIVVFAVSLPLTPLYDKIGQEFMPPLNEGDLLFMPVMLPGASITQAKSVMSIQDRIISQFPEVVTVVGKLGRAETATDPAPIGMFETIINLEDPRNWARRAVRLENSTKLVKQVADRIIAGGLISEDFANRIDDSLLFTTGLDPRTDLDNGKISRGLRRKFEKKEGLLSPGATVSIREKDVSWLITDEDNKRAYIVRRDEDKLNIYNDGIATAVGHGASGRLDEMAVQYYNPNISISEQERLYRIWLIRLIMEEIVKRKVGEDALGVNKPEFETKLHAVAMELEPLIQHGRYLRKKTRNELINDLIEATRLPGVSPIMTQPIRNRIDMLATGIQTPVGIKVFGNDLAKIEEIAIEIEQVLKTIPGALGPYAERIGNKPYIEFHIDRNEAARYGIKVGDIQQILMTAVGGMNLTTTIEGQERYPIRVRYMRELRDNMEALKRVFVPTPKGAQIPLQQLVNIERRPGPAKVASENTRLFSRVFCDVDVDRIGLVDFVNKAKVALAEKIKPNLPSGYSYAFSGQYEAEIEARNRLILVVPICLAVIFLLLYINFRSPAAVLAIFFAIPFAFIGGMWLQWLMQFVPGWMGGGGQIKYSTPVWIGYIALFGVAVEDGIVLIEYLLERVRGGEPVKEAAINAGLLRVRPIIMTTATTVLALMPILLYEVSTNTGAELMKPIAVPTFGGMLTCTVTNLILAPVIFSLFYPIEHWFIRRREKAVEPTAVVDETTSKSNQ